MQLKYSDFISGLQRQNIILNRKVLSDLAMTEPFSFKALVDQVAFMRGGRPVAHTQTLAATAQLATQRGAQAQQQQQQ